MGLFQYISDWKNQLEAKRMAEAESLGHCPECNGRGFHMPFATEYYLPEVFDCIECNGTGSFSNYEAKRKSRLS